MTRAAPTTLLRAFTKAARGHGLRVIMDLVVNHTAKDSELAARRPQWFARDATARSVRHSRSIRMIPKRRRYGAISPNSTTGRRSATRSSAYFEDLVRHYVGLGFRGFRCDAAYKVPATVWRRLIGAAKASDPDVVFCAENLGASEEEVLALDGAGFDYLFNSLKWWDFESPWLLDQYEKFRHIAPSIGVSGEPRHRAARHRIAGGRVSGGPDRGALSAGLCVSAAFSTGVMMPMGFEFGWSRRISVVPNGDEGRRSRRASTCNRLSPRSTA